MDTKLMNLDNNIPATTTDIVKTTKNLSEKEITDIKSKAVQVVEKIKSSTGSALMDISDEVTNVGIQDQKSTASKIEIMQEKMGNVFFGDSKNTATENISKDITSLQTVLAKINPEDIKKEGRYKLLRFIPFVGTNLVDILKESATKGQTIQQFIEHIEESLTHGELTLRQDNAGLKVLYITLENTKKLIQADAFLAEEIISELEKAIETETDENKKSKLNDILFQVSVRDQDLRALENIHEQFKVTIEMTRSNNDMLIKTVQRMITLGMGVVWVSMAISTALMHRQNVLDAYNGSRNFIGDRLVANATMINNQVKEMGDIYNNPVVALDKMQKSIELLSQAIDATNKMKAEAIVNSKKNAARIIVMTEQIKDKSGQLPSSEIKSLEATRILELPVGKE